MKSSLHFYLFLLLPTLAIAQKAERNKSLEILKEELAHSSADTNRVLILAEICTLYEFYNMDSLDYYSKQGLELARRLQFHKGGARILNNQGLAAAFRGNASEALSILFKALRIAEDNKLAFETANCLNSIGASYWFINDFNKANEFITRAAKIDETVHHTQSNIYWRIMIQVWSAINYIQFNKLDSAKMVLQKAYENAFNPDYKDFSGIRPTILMFMGIAQSDSGNKDAALSYLKQSVEGFKSDDDNFGTADASYNIAKVFKYLNQSDSAIYYSKLGLEVASKIDYKSTLLSLSKMLADLYENTDIKQSNEYWKMVVAVNDSLYGAAKTQKLQKTLFEEQRRQQLAQEQQMMRENQLKQYGFMSGLGILTLIGLFLYRNNLQKQKANELLQKQKDEIDEKGQQLEKSLFQLKSTQAQLIQSEKMASLGELTAGIAHEIQNPLNFVSNFSELNRELVTDLNEEINKGNIEDVKAIANDIRQNSEKINQHGLRASSIVKGMLEHSRTSSGVKEPTDINKLCEEYIRLSYHARLNDKVGQGLRAKDKNLPTGLAGFNCDYKLNLDPNLSLIPVVSQDIGRVLLNLVNNAFQACAERSLDALENSKEYKPLVTLTTKNTGEGIEIIITDNGPGIPDNIKDKIFQPFFTTKPTGQGTGLGLSLAYDIIKAHGGEIKMESKIGEGTEFLIHLPI